MKKYVLTSPSFAGSVELGYDFNGHLVFYSYAAEMSEKQLQWFLPRLPKNEVELNGLKAVVKGELKEVPADLSFDAFWDKYDKKINRKRCEPIWKKLTDAQKMQALMNVPAYDSYLQRTGIGKAHPDNYLTREYFSVDWRREK